MDVDMEWESGRIIATFDTKTCGPEGRWHVEMRLCNASGGGWHFVVHDPFADRLMWFSSGDRFEAGRAFSMLVGLAMMDANDNE